VVLVDDVLYTGRTVRGRRSTRSPTSAVPNRFSSPCWSDRGERELPIRADYVGRNIDAPRDQRVYVRLTEVVRRSDEVVIGGSKRGAFELSAMARLGKNDVVSIEDLTTVDIERIFEPRRFVRHRP